MQIEYIWPRQKQKNDPRQSEECSGFGKIYNFQVGIGGYFGDVEDSTCRGIAYCSLQDQPTCMLVITFVQAVV